MAAEWPVVSFIDDRDFDCWLADHHGAADGVWLLVGKKSSDVPSIGHEEALLTAIRWGWVDGQKRARDGSYWLQAFTPRRQASVWSKRNRRLAESLMESGRMNPAGAAEVEAARRDGRWDRAFDGQGTVEPPSDFLSALGRNAEARLIWNGLDKRNRSGILYRIDDARRPETRARRIELYVAMLARGEKLHS